MSNVDCLIRGDEYLKKSPDFQLTGRDDELKKLHAILMRKRSNSAIITGPGGAGASAICMGLESKKDDAETPLDILRKRKFWLDTDSLFSSGDSKIINETFQKLTARLSRTSQSVLIIDDMKDFIEGCRNSGCSNLINSLMRDIKAGKYQAILESRDEDLDVVIKCHSDMREVFTIMDLQEAEGANLEAIVKSEVEKLEKHHRIKISPEAVHTAIEVTTKYRANDPGLNRAQPERAITLLDRTLTRYRQEAHSTAPEVIELETRLAEITKARAEKAVIPEHLKGMSSSDIENLQVSLETDLKEAKAEWDRKREKITSLHKDQLDAEQLIRDKEDEIARLEAEEKERHKVKDDASKQKGVETANVADFLESAREGGFKSPAIKELEAKIKKYQDAAEKSRTEYNKHLAEINAKLLLTKDHVLHQFSALSGIPANRLGQDERQKLKTLEPDMKSRVFDQDHVVKPLANSIKAARVGLRPRNKPMASFLFIGPSGSGKTQLAKTATELLFEDERALVRLDMSEYQEKHAVAKLIGAPPGYEGFEAGGFLTNAMRKNPNRTVLFDEAEKAHKDVFDLMLQITDEARLTDNLGRPASFSDSIVIVTSNIGSQYFLDPNLSYEEAVELATKDLEEKFRPEFLNRFNGRRNIKFFKPLSLDGIERIAKRELSNVNDKIRSNGLKIDMPDEDLKKMCKDIYKPAEGARGIVGYIQDHMDEDLSNTILETPDAKGVMLVHYNDETNKLEIAPPVANDVLPAITPVQTSPTQAFALTKG